MPVTDKNYAKKVKNRCKICFETVTKKNGLRCEGACKKWIHYKCLNYSPEKIQDIQQKVIKVLCPCPNCGTKGKDIEKSKNCGKAQCPASFTPECCGAIKCQAKKSVSLGCRKPACPGDCAFVGGEPQSCSGGQTPRPASQPMESPRPCPKTAPNTETNLKTDHIPAFPQKPCCCEKCKQARVGQSIRDRRKVNQSSDTETIVTVKTKRSACTTTPSMIGLHGSHSHAKVVERFAKKTKIEAKMSKTRLASPNVHGGQPGDYFSATERQNCGRNYKPVEYNLEEDAKCTTSLPSIVLLVDDVEKPKGKSLVSHCKSDFTMSLSFINRNNMSAILEQMRETVGLLQTQFKDLVRHMVDVVNTSDTKDINLD